LDAKNRLINTDTLESELSPFRARARRCRRPRTEDEHDGYADANIGRLGVILMFLGVSILLVRAIAGSIRSMFAPRVIIIQNDSIYKREPSLVDTYKPMVTAFFWLILLLVFFGPHH
jgi:hypothetical protein